MRTLLILAAIATLFAGVLNAQEVKTQIAAPVTLDVDADHGTCSIGYRVNAGGANLREGPGSDFPLIIALPAGKVIAGCEERDGWLGIIDGQDETCSIGIMLTAPRPYVGSCLSGWIEQRLLTGVYG